MLWDVAHYTHFAFGCHSFEALDPGIGTGEGEGLHR
jgi:hypothetical protein